MNICIYSQSIGVLPFELLIGASLFTVHGDKNTHLETEIHRTEQDIKQDNAKTLC
jgi:hypothetical protein